MMTFCNHVLLMTHYNSATQTTAHTWSFRSLNVQFGRLRIPSSRDELVE